MREKASFLLQQIPSDMKELTVHDITHVDALWEMGSIVSMDTVELNPPEAFVFGGAVLLHDAAMSLAAYPSGIDGLKEELIWKDSYSRLMMEVKDLGNKEVTEPELIEQATKEALRKLHASQAEKLPIQAWPTSDSQSEYLIESSEIRNFYGPKIGQIAHSHWWSVAQIEDELSNDLGPLGGRTNNSIDLIKIACLLRISDVIHLDRRRAPFFLRLLIKPQGISADHWEFQERMAVPIVDNGALKYSAAPDFSIKQAEAWWLAFDAITLVDKELREVDQLLQKRATGRLNVNRVLGISSASELSKYIETDGWEPVDCTVRVTDVPKIVSTLGGEKLYGDDPSVAIRELIQNSADAIIVRRSMQKRDSDWGTISVRLEVRESEHWLIIEDTGIGMSPGVLTGPLIDFGNSFWRSPMAADEFPGLHAAGISTTGRYGIGFFSIFMLGSRVRITSRRYDKASDSGRTLEFQNGLGSRPILYESPPEIVPVDGGTRVEVCLKQDPREAGGLLRKTVRYKEETQKLEYLVASIAPNLNVELKVAEEDTDTTVVHVGDWLNIEEDRLFSRLLGAVSGNKEKTSIKPSRLRKLTGQDGTIYGRAMVETSEFGGWRKGCISVGGLRASDISLIRGVLIGQEITVLRNKAAIAAPVEVLAAWASEQATLIYDASLIDEDKARGAAVILLFGGKIGSLPFARWRGEWLSTEEIKELLTASEEVAVLLDYKFEYDAELDDVHPKDFHEYFEESEEILFVYAQLPGYESRSDIHKLIPNISTQDQPWNTFDLFKVIISEIWGEHKEEGENRIVGSVSGNNICRNVTVFYRLSEE